MLLIFLPYRTRNELKEAKRAIAASIPLVTSTSHIYDGPPANNQITLTTAEGNVRYNPTSQESLYEGIDNRQIVQGGGNEATITKPDSMSDDVDDSFDEEIPASIINDDDGNGDEGDYINDSVIKMRRNVNKV